MQVKIMPGVITPLDVEIPTGGSTLSVVLSPPDALAQSPFEAAATVDTPLGRTTYFSSGNTSKPVLFSALPAGRASILVHTETEDGIRVGRLIDCEIRDRMAHSVSVDFTGGHTVSGTIAFSAGTFMRVSLLAGAVDTEQLREEGFTDLGYPRLTHDLKVRSGELFELEYVSPGVNTLVVRAPNEEVAAAEVIEVGEDSRHINLSLP